MTDFVHTENTEGYGCPQADEVGKQQLSKIGQQLKKIYISTDDTEGQGLIKDYSHIIYFQRCSSSYASF